MKREQLNQAGEGLAARGARVLAFARSTSMAAALALFTATVLVLPGPAAAQESTPASASATASVNINTADVALLASTLQGVGESRAEEIVRYRESYGPFESVEELADVKGVGPATLERNRGRITLD